jgi:hypothetical protein
MTLKCTPTLGVALLWESRMFRALVEMTNKHRIRAPWYHWKVLEVKMPKVPSHCSFRCNMHELWSKEGLRVKLEIWLPTTNPFRARFNDFWLGRSIHCWKDLFENYKILPLHVPKKWFEKDMNIQSFKITKVLILGLPFESPWKKCLLDVAHAKSHRV